MYTFMTHFFEIYIATITLLAAITVIIDEHHQKRQRQIDEEREERAKQREIEKRIAMIKRSMEN